MNPAPAFPPPPEISQAEQFLPLVYNDLRRMAAHRLALHGPGHTLQPTAVVHDVWLRLAHARARTWEGRVHFLAAAAEVMRHVLIDHLRGKSRLKRGGGQLRLDIDEFEIAEAPPDEKVLLMNEALELLERSHPDKARVVVLKFFGGLTDQEAATELGVTERTIERHWAYAKAWLLREIRGQN